MAIISEKSDVGLPPWFFKRAVELSRAVGRVTFGGMGSPRGFGTGFLVAPQLMLTCRHVLPDVANSSGSTFEIDKQNREDGSYKSVTSLKLRPDMRFVANEALDFTIVALESAQAHRPVLPLTSDGDVRVGDRGSLFHHPLGGPLRLAIRTGTILASNEDFLRHDGDTEGGSAGGPL